MAMFLFGEKIRVIFSRLSWIELVEATLIGGLFFIVVAYVPVLQDKISFYINERGDLHLLSFTVSFILVTYFTNFNIGVLSEFLFYLILILIFGESRINILVFFSLWNILYFKKKSPEVVSFAISMYLSIKGIIFINAIYSGGSGF